MALSWAAVDSVFEGKFDLAITADAFVLLSIEFYSIFIAETEDN